MAFILGVRRKTARQPHGGLAANFWFFIQPWGIRNDLESIRKCFSFGKIRNLEKNITWDYSRVPQFPVFRSRPEVETMTLHNVRVNSIYSQSFIQIGPLVSEILRCTPKMNPILFNPIMRPRTGYKVNSLLFTMKHNPEIIEHVFFYLIQFSLKDSLWLSPCVGE